VGEAPERVTGRVSILPYLPAVIVMVEARLITVGQTERKAM